MTRLAVFMMGLALLSPLSIGVARASKQVACTVATGGDSPVAQACAKGGRAAAKKTMKQMASAANKGGGEFQCAGCHADTKSYKLTGNARGDFKKLLAAAGQ